jgi:hypothetical protein
MAVAIPVAIDVALEGLAAAAAWALRAYRIYRAAQAAEEAIAKAQEAAKDKEEAEEKAKTDAQAKADATTSADCKNCNEDPDCQTARDKLKEAVYGIKGDTTDTNRGLAERLCHWLHGPDEALRESHLQALKDAAKRVEKAREWLKGTGDRPYGKKEGATLSKKQKASKPQNCAQPTDLMKDAQDLEDMARDVAKGNSTIQPLPRADFAAACAKDALGLVNKAFGK